MGILGYLWFRNMGKAGYMWYPHSFSSNYCVYNLDMTWNEPKLTDIFDLGIAVTVETPQRVFNMIYRRHTNGRHFFFLDTYNTDEIISAAKAVEEILRNNPYAFTKG